MPNLASFRRTTLIAVAEMEETRPSVAVAAIAGTPNRPGSRHSARKTPRNCQICHEAPPASHPESAIPPIIFNHAKNHPPSMLSPGSRRSRVSPTFATKMAQNPIHPCGDPLTPPRTQAISAPQPPRHSRPPTEPAQIGRTHGDPLRTHSEEGRMYPDRPPPAAKTEICTNEATLRLLYLAGDRSPTRTCRIGPSAQFREKKTEKSAESAAQRPSPFIRTPRARDQFVLSPQNRRRRLCKNPRFLHNSAQAFAQGERQSERPEPANYLIRVHSCCFRG